VNVARESMPDPTWLADAGASISGSVQCWFHHVLRSVLSPSILAKTLPVLRRTPTSPRGTCDPDVVSVFSIASYVTF